MVGPCRYRAKLQDLTIPTELGTITSYSPTSYLLRARSPTPSVSPVPDIALEQRPRSCASPPTRAGSSRHGNTSPALSRSESMGRRSWGRLACIVAACCVLLSPGGLSAQRLPRPDSSRAPILTQLASDSIRLQVRQLRLFELMGGLQRGDSAAVEAAVAGTQWGAADLASRRSGPCVTLGAAVRAYAARLRAEPAGSSRAVDVTPPFFSR